MLNINSILKLAISIGGHLGLADYIDMAFFIYAMSTHQAGYTANFDCKIYATVS